MSDDRDQKLVSEIRRWAERPPRTPAGAARTRIVARLGERQAAPPVRWAAAAALAVALALTVGLLWEREPAPSGEPRSAAAPAPAAAAAESESLIVYQLESGTMLFVTLPTLDGGEVSGGAI